MKAISLKDYPEKQYATWVEQGHKDIETRKWKPRSFKPGDAIDILICCSKKSATENAGLAICVVELYHIELMREEHEDRACCGFYRRRSGEPAWAWFFRNRRTLSRKFPVSGELSLFDVDIPADITFIKEPCLYTAPAPIFLQKQTPLL